MFLTPASATDDQLLTDPVGIDPALEIAHLYHAQWPTGIAVSSSGRKFSCYPAGLDRDNTNDGTNQRFAVAELTSNNAETPYPNFRINNPPGGAIDYSKTPAVTKGLSEYFLGVQAVVVDYEDTLWVLDTGRATTLNDIAAAASPGGTKLIVIDLATDQVTRTYIFAPDVALPFSYFDNVRIDLQNNFAFISDSAGGQDAIIVLDLTSGDAWRTLQNDRSVSPTYGFVPFVWGDSQYQVTRDAAGTPDGATFINFGVGGIALSPTLDTLYYSKIAGRNLYAIPTALLRNRNTTQAELVAYVRDLGEKGFSEGMTTASDGRVYLGQAEQDGCAVYDPRTQLVELFVHDKRINFCYSFSVTVDGYIYFTVNQLNYSPLASFGQERRVRPFVLFRVKLPGDAVKAPGF